MTKTTLRLGRIERTIKTNGWSWGAFLLGALWYFGHGMWGKGLGYILIGAGLCWTIIVPLALPFAMAARFNREHYEYLVMHGYEEVE